MSDIKNKLYKGGSPWQADGRLRLRACPYWSRMKADQGRKFDSTAKGCIKKISMVESSWANKGKADPIPCTLHIVSSINILKVQNGAPYRYTTQSYEYFRHMPLFFVIRRLSVCGGSALAAITKPASSSSLNPTYLPWPQSSYGWAVRCIFSFPAAS